MYEAKERQKFISDAQYLREMQHKMDSEYQACLRKQEHIKDQSDKKQEHSRQELRQRSLSSISPVRRYERPWISRLPVNRQIPSDEISGSDPKSNVKSHGNKSEAKFPAIDKTSVKQKQKSSSCMKKNEKSGSGPKKDMQGFPKSILSRRQQMNQRNMLENPDSEAIRKAEGKGRKTPMLQGVAKITRGSEPQNVTAQRNGPIQKTKKKPQEKKNIFLSSKLNISNKNLDQDLKKGNILTVVQQSLANSVDSSVQTANNSFISNESSNSNLPPIRNTLIKPKEDDFYTALCSNVEASVGINDTKNDNLEQDLSVDLNKPLLDQSRGSAISLIQVEQHNCETVVGSDGNRAELSHRFLRQHDVIVDSHSLGQRKVRDQKKSYSLEENLLEEAHKNESEHLHFNTKRPQAENGPETAATIEAPGNLNSPEDWQGSNVYDRERQSFESNQRCYAGFISARSTMQRPSVHSTLNIPGTLVQTANRSDMVGNVDVATSSVQITELNGNPRLTARRQLSPIRIRDSFSGAESCQSSSPTASHFDDSNLLDDTISNGLSSISPSIASHDEDNFLNSHSSSSSTDSSPPSLFRTNFTAHLHMTGPLPDQVPIFLTVSDLRNQSNYISNTTMCDSVTTKDINKAETDPEKLKKLQESLLAEDPEEEGDQCRICQIAGGSVTNPLLEPCGCGGSLRFVHQECLKSWLKAKIKSGAELGAVKTCELCKQNLTVDLDDFNVNDYYRNHQQSRAQDELMNSGLYLVLLLHLYEQRFAELMRLNYNQASRDRLSRQPRTEENQNPTNSANSG
ncbi:probable E3 ubiquitin-protein ligase MARCHF10 isoform X1 [Crotalus tigris]|uniref:probable E3 ubiquitin-protein ligase MARCHF10 isoform X1 n=1 Tax=Crotalus tigris TaxID=88082 RepID=UPI00192F604D|nr:probable E3 ubiquitin-protein ligase MARCHF10 isoform X1 [Crotalus tigris]XP_039204115.1 probable E3 ubiquitin-protein ligase MARCHF10 isoform X1 [Crotalus tigris]XP_039204116.1 probable E3 ubiquitin-protein ligase MARCHF10 isoform X1 [Crotalus tigris]